jgi:hypothetical protein
MFRTFVRIAILANAALTLHYAYRVVKYEIEKLATTETVMSAPKYVMVKAARGHYKDCDLNQILVDYRFFEQIKNFHE